MEPGSHQMSADKSAEFVTLLAQAVQDGSFLRLSLSGYRGEDTDLKKIEIKPVAIKQRLHLSFTFRRKTNDIVKNFLPDDALAKIRGEIGDFANGALFTTTGDAAWQRSGAKQTLKTSTPRTTEAASLSHDRQKNRLIEAKGQHYLQALGITDAKGQVRDKAQDKFRQINKYIEILSGILPAPQGGQALSIADMGSGKGYLTFALYDYLQQAGIPARITGIEYRADMVELCNRIAQEQGFTGLSFVQGSIADWQADQLDVLIALHACDTATDDALASGVHAQARLIVVAPCCHKQIRKELEAAQPGGGQLEFILRYGTFTERQAEMLTDAMRALLLETRGYATKVFEFISDAHTPKNVMITASRTERPRKDAAGEYQAAKTYFGIRRHHLEDALQN